jgi:hypothetical protein
MLIFASVFSFVITLLLITLWFYLAEFQRMLPSEFGAKIVQAYKSNDFQTLRKYGDNLPPSFQSDAIFAKYIAEFEPSDEFYFYPVLSKKDDQIIFDIANKSKTFATLTIENTHKKSFFGFAIYNIVSLRQEPLFKYSITAPQEVSILLDGHPINERYLTKDSETITSFSQVQTEPIQYKTYRIYDFYYFETLTTGPSSTKLEIHENEANHSYVVAKVPSENDIKEVSDFSLNVSKIYTYFVTRGGAPIDKLTPLLYPNTAFYKSIVTYDNRWGAVYEGHSFENVIVENIIKYTDTEYSCDIQYDYIIKFKSGYTNLHRVSFRYFVTKKSGKWLLVDKKMN